MRICGLLNERKVENKNPITEDNSLWGNFIDSEFRYTIENEMYKKEKNAGQLLATGLTTYDVNEDKKNNYNMIFNIYDLAGNLNEWTMERELDRYIIVRGGSFDQKGSQSINNYVRYNEKERSSNTGIRVVLFID